jgi:hypothetical protein
MDGLAALSALAASAFSLWVWVSSDSGWFTLLIAALPAPVAFLPLVLPQPARQPARVAAAVVLWAFYFIAGLSVGVYFLPSAILMTIAAASSSSRAKPGVWAVWAAATGLVLAIAAGLWEALSPYAYVMVSEEESGTVTPSGEAVFHIAKHTEHASLIAVNGVWVVMVAVAIPVMIAALGLFGAVKGYRALIWVAAVVLLAFSFLAGLLAISFIAGLSGVFYIPAAIALLAAALAGRPRLPAL